MGYIKASDRTYIHTESVMGSKLLTGQIIHTESVMGSTNTLSLIMANIYTESVMADVMADVRTYVHT